MFTNPAPAAAAAIAGSDTVAEAARAGRRPIGRSTTTASPSRARSIPTGGAAAVPASSR